MDFVTNKHYYHQTIIKPPKYDQHSIINYHHSDLYFIEQYFVNVIVFHFEVTIKHLKIYFLLIVVIDAIVICFMLVVIIILVAIVVIINFLLLVVQQMLRMGF